MQNAERSSFLYGANSAFIEDLFERFVQDPQSVDESWRTFFAELSAEQREVLREVTGASWAPKRTRVVGVADPDAPPPAANRNVKANGAAAKAEAPAGFTDEQVRAAALEAGRARILIRSFRVRGHLQADLDPLGLTPKPYHPELDPKTSMASATPTGTGRSWSIMCWVSAKARPFAGSWSA